jgi:hypothetical protein
MNRTRGRCAAPSYEHRPLRGRRACDVVPAARVRRVSAEQERAAAQRQVNRLRPEFEEMPARVLEMLAAARRHGPCDLLHYDS